MDLYFQGMAWLNKGHAPENVAQAHRCFDRALIADPGNVDALVGSARADAVDGINLFETDPAAALAAAEAKLIKALSSVPDHPRGHMWLGLVDLWTKYLEFVQQSGFPVAAAATSHFERRQCGRGQGFAETPTARRRGVC
jgi:hypothetical protein